jgi:hypothetical protein
MTADRLTTATAKISGVIRWADQQGLPNIAAELRAALDLLPAEVTGAHQILSAPPQDHEERRRIAWLRRRLTQA